MPEPYQPDPAVIEEMATEIHHRYLQGLAAADEHPRSRPAHVEWAELADEFRAQNRHQASTIFEVLHAAGYRVMRKQDLVEGTQPVTDLAGDHDDGDALIVKLAAAEHNRWMRQKFSQGYRYGPETSVEHRTHQDMVHWDDLDDAAREKDIRPMRDIPAVCAAAGLVIVRI